MNEHILPTLEVEPSTEIATVENATALPSLAEPTTSVYDKVTNVIEFVSVMGAKLAKSGFAGCQKIEQGEILILEAMTRGMSPMQFAANFHIINNKVTMRSDALGAAFERKGGIVEWIQFDELAAVANFTIHGQTTKISFTMKDAAKAGLPNRGGAWKTYPAEMLRARLMAKAIRMVSPSCLQGLYTTDEASDMSTPAQDKPLFQKN